MLVVPTSQTQCFWRNKVTKRKLFMLSVLVVGMMFALATTAAAGPPAPAKTRSPLIATPGLMPGVVCAIGSTDGFLTDGNLPSMLTCAPIQTCPEPVSGDTHGERTRYSLEYNR